MGLPVGLPRGTSPRVRGKLISDALLDLGKRYIPACAGEAPWFTTRATVIPVHPRVCGGSSFVGWLALSGPGTSPRVRGKHEASQARHLINRYIPACAGEARNAKGLSYGLQVHPRVCGGSPPSVAQPPNQAGTSPRVRGKLRRERARRFAEGYIPACAGEACRAASGSRRTGVHPRVCGGSDAARQRPELPPGTSPRVRGKPRPRPLDRRRRGYIPACAGEATC